MRPEEFRQFIIRQPFQPFRVTLTDGRTFDVVHPEMAMVGRSVVTIGIPAEDKEEPIADRMVTISLIRVMQVEVLEASPQGE